MPVRGSHIFAFGRKNQSRFSNFIRRKQQPTKILPEQKWKFRFITTPQQCVSAIGFHLMQNPESATQYSNDHFSILAKARSMFDLRNQEANSLSPKRVCFFTLNFSQATMQLVSNGNVAPLVSAHTTFEIQSISIQDSILIRNRETAFECNKKNMDVLYQ